jgi:hypothetical protein
MSSGFLSSLSCERSDSFVHLCLNTAKNPRHSWPAALATLTLFWEKWHQDSAIDPLLRLTPVCLSYRSHTCDLEQKANVVVFAVAAVWNTELFLGKWHQAFATDPATAPDSGMLVVPESQPAIWSRKPLLSFLAGAAAQEG